MFLCSGKGFGILAMLFLVLGCSTVEEKSYSIENTNIFYVSPNGNDSNDGLSPETAWQTSAKVNSDDFLPGYTILFDGGHTYQSITFDANDGGDSNNRITISSYGEGVAVFEGMDFVNTSGFNVTDVDVVIPQVPEGEFPRNGVNLYSTLDEATKLQGFQFSNLNVSGGYGGIAIEGVNDTSGFSDVSILNCTIFDCMDSGIISKGYFNQNKAGYSHEHIYVQGCTVYNISGWDNQWSHSGNGIVLSDVQFSSISNCVVYDSGYNNTHCGGNCGIWYWDAKDVAIEYCEAYNIETQGCDAAGFDLDGGVVNGIMQYNYSHDNDGAGFQVGQFNGARPMSNITVRYNISDNDANGYSGSLFLFNKGRAEVSNVCFFNNTVIQDDKLAFKSISNWETGIAFVKNNILDGDIEVDTNIEFEGNSYENPNLVDYKLEPGSPLIDAGINLDYNIGDYDYFGNASLSGESQDIGAHEFSNTLSID
ncbi:hypothetical protein BKM32_12240 [Mangrovimonas sp. DI 80]|nr:hypothetical protein BKM32_12240 [Mangrovimonas sp. DI 80]